MLFAVDRVDVVDEDFVDLIFALEASFWIELTENDLVEPI